MKKIVLAAIGIFSLAGVAAAAMGGHHGGEHGMHQGAMFGEKLHQQLNLTGEQEIQWQALKTQHDTMHKQMRDAHMQNRAAIKAEMDKPQPDLAAVNNMMEAAQDQDIAARKAFHKDALKFYASLSPDRQSIVVNDIKSMMGRMHGVRERNHGMHDKTPITQ
jgi:uncharacterized membrane protein